MMTFSTKLLGRLGRRYWMARASRLICRAHEQGLIDSWLLHEMHARLEEGDPSRAYPKRTVRAERDLAREDQP